MMLVILDPGSSPIESRACMDIAAYISAVYSNSTVDCSKPFGDREGDFDDGNLWEEVGRMVLVMARVREHERWFVENGTYVKPNTYSVFAGTVEKP